MKALWRQDWYRSGRKLVLLMGLMCVLAAWFYGMSIYAHTAYTKGTAPMGYGGAVSFQQLMSFYDSRMLPIWLLPLVTTCIAGKMVTDDRRSGWYRLCCAMPLTRRQYVTQKYLFGLTFMGASIVFVMLCQVVYVVWLDVFDWRLMILFFLRYMMVFLAVTAVLTVLSFWSFGFALLCEIMLLIAVPFIITLVLAFVAPELFAVYDQVGRMIRWLYDDPVGIVCGGSGSVVLYALSYWLCLRIAGRQEV